MQTRSTNDPAQSGFPTKIPWSRFQSEFSSTWNPGEHVSIIGMTGCGKSTLAASLCRMWEYVLAFDVKADGSCPIGKRVTSYPTWRMLSANGPHHYRIAPGYGPSARRVFDDAFRKVWTAGKTDPGAGSWTVYLDELKILSDKLRLRDHIESMYIAGRSRGITLIGATQAPRDVPSDFYDQARYFFIGTMKDTRTLDRNGEIIGDRQRLRDVIPRLEPYEFYVSGPGDFEAIVKTKARH